jgi:hypothetical protein
MATCVGRKVCVDQRKDGETNDHNEAKKQKLVYTPLPMLLVMIITPEVARNGTGKL